MRKISKVIARRIDAFVRSGRGHSPAPDFSNMRPETVDRHLLRETHSNWKVKCNCGKQLLISSTNITKVAYEVDNWHGHESHRKTVFLAKGLQLSYRGVIPENTTAANPAED